MKWMLPRIEVIQEASQVRIPHMAETLDSIAFFAAVILIPIWVGTVIFQVFCIVYARFASAKCARIAHDSGWDANFYARRGALHAALLLAPWVHLVRRMEDKPYSFGTNRFGYAPLYILWLVVIAANVSVLIMTVLREGPWTWIHTIILLVPVALGMFPWILTLLLLLRKRSEVSDRMSDARNDEFAERVYLVPFVWTSVNILAIPCAALIAIVVGLVISAGIFAIPLLFIMGIVAWLVLSPFF